MLSSSVSRWHIGGRGPSFDSSVSQCFALVGKWRRAVFLALALPLAFSFSLSRARGRDLNTLLQFYSLRVLQSNILTDHHVALQALDERLSVLLLVSMYK